LRSNQVPLILRAVWFVLLGWEIGLTMAVFAYLCCLTIVGIPFGIWLMHRIPLVMTLQLNGISERYSGGSGYDEITISGKVYRVNKDREPSSMPFLIRAIWFVCAGWWLTLLWMKVATILCVLILPMPIGFWMFNRVPAILTLDGV